MENDTNITFKGKSILITGGTGSLGKHTTKYLLNSFPEIDRIIIFTLFYKTYFIQYPSWFIYPYESII